MIQKLEISGLHLEVDDDLRAYVHKKIGRLDTYVPRHARESVHAEVKLKGRNAKHKDERICEVILHLPKGTLTVKESTTTIYAAVDIAEEKLKTQLHKYKALHAPAKFHRRVLNRLKREDATSAADLQA